MKNYSFDRSEKIAKQIHHDVVDILRTSVKDPRLSNWLTINHVTVSKDLSIAKIYWSILKEDKHYSIQRALNNAKGFIKSQIAAKFNTYTIPEIMFVYDENLQKANKVISILDKIIINNEEKE